MMLNYRFAQNATYLLACSYGPDSMALFDMLLKKKVRIVVCHVNYHKRPEAEGEEKDLRSFCQAHQVPLEVLDTAGLVMTGNFQEWAREVRYAFFAEMYEKHHAEGLLIAHHQDDLIETYLLQKKRDGVVQTYGLKEVARIMEMKVIRPLLRYSKEDLLAYDRENMVPYSIDQSNFEMTYLRNKIRKEIVNKLSPIEREQLIAEIDHENDEMAAFLSDLHAKMPIGEELDIRSLIALSPREFEETVISFIDSAGKKHVDVSRGRIAEIRKLCLSPKPNLAMQLADRLYLVKEYDVLVLSYETRHEPYSYVMEKPGLLDVPELFLDFSGGAEERNIKASDYPLTIRNAHEDDEIAVGGAMCSLRRLFIDWKMPARFRDQWPVFINKNGVIVYVPRYRKKFRPSGPSIMKIRFTGNTAGS